MVHFHIVKQDFANHIVCDTAAFSLHNNIV